MTLPNEELALPAFHGHGVSLRDAFKVWARVAMLSFGGPAGQIAVMHRIVVEEKRWVSENRFLHALNFCMLLPGPEAQQLATYIGWLMHGIPGGLIAGGLFILPGIVAIMALSIAYAIFGQVGIVSALFFGLKAAVLAIVLDAVVRVARRALKTDTLRAIAVLAFLGIFFFAIPFPLIVILAGIAGFIGGKMELPGFKAGGGHGPGKSASDADRPALIGDHSAIGAERSLPQTMALAAIWLALWLGPVALIVSLLGGGSVFSQIALFFSKMAVVTFGGAYAVLAYVAQQAVDGFHWLKPGEMLDGLGMAETTPGPLIMVLQFVGFMAAYRDPGALSPLAAGIAGGLLATWVTFAPCFLWIFAAAPFIERLRGHTPLAGALSAITAAVVGVILNLAVWFAIHVIFKTVVTVSGYGFHFDMPVLASVDPAAFALSTAAIIAIFGFRIGMVPVLAGCSAAGLTLHLLGLVA